MLTWLLRSFRKAIPLGLLRDKAVQYEGSVRRTPSGHVAMVHPYVAHRKVGPVTGTPEHAYQRSTQIAQTAQRLKTESDWPHPLLWEDHETRSIVQDLANEAGYRPDDAQWKNPSEFLSHKLALIGLHKVDRHLDGTPKLSPAGSVLPVGGEDELKLAIWRAATVGDDESDELRKAIEQLGLYDATVPVRGYVRETGRGLKFVAPHVATRKKALPVETREPWQIPHKEFVNQPYTLNMFNNTKYSATYQATTSTGYVGFATWWKFDGEKGKLKAKEDAAKDLRGRLSVFHLEQVKAAVALGLPVPDEVINEYQGVLVRPDLTKGIEGGGPPIDYKTEFQGLDITIENRKGSIRRWRDRNGKEGETKMTHAYGYIRGTQGVDGDHVDCFLGPNPDATHAYVIHAMAVPDFKRYDEDKVMLGFESADDAKRAFLENYTDPRFFGSMHTLTMEDFKKKALATKDKPAMIKALSDADQRDYDQETSEIQKRSKKEGRHPHTFAAARWTHPNGHPRCQVCGDEERTGGMCPGKPAIRMVFAKASCSPGDNCRWITVHPGGSGEGQPILIRESKTDKGTFHVIGGAGGKLNYLKLTNVKSESEYKQQAVDRAKQKKEAAKERAKQDKEAGTYEPKKKALGELKNQTQQHERALIDHVAKSMGWENYDLRPEQLDGLSDAAKGLLVAKHHRQLLRDAMEVVKQTRERLLNDAEARAEAALGELSIHRTEPDVLGLTDLMPPGKDAGKGYVTRYEEKAEATGLDEDQLEKELGELKEQRKAELPPGSAEAGERLHAAMERIRHEVKQAETSGKVATRERNRKPVPPNKAMALLTMAKQVQQVQTQSRKKAEAIKTGKETVAKSYVIESKPVTSEELIAELEADAQERERQDLCKSFLRTVETPLSIEDPDEHADALERHIQVGATNALTRASLGLTGQDVLPHDVIAVLGTAGAAQALAHAMHTKLSPEDVHAFADRLAAYHQQHHVEAAREAVARAQELSEQAREIQLGTVETPSELAVASELNAKRVERLREARALLGSTLGEMEAVAALEYALQAGPVDHIKVSLGTLNNETAIKQLRALGLAKEDYTIESDGKNRYATVNATGIPKLTRRIDPEEAKRYEYTRAVMNGEHDEAGWLPAGFARRPQSSYTDPNEQAIAFAQPFSVSSHGLVEEDLKEYIGSQMADGVPVAHIYSSLLSHDLVNKVPEEHRQAYFEAIDRLAPLRDAEGQPVRAEAHTDTFKRMAEEYVTKKFGPHAAPLHAQYIDPTSKETFEALHRVLAEDPRRMIAFKKIGDLTPQDQAVLRRHFEKTFAKPEQNAMVKEQLAALGPEPAKESDGLFGVQENPEWREWHTQRQALLDQANQTGLSWDKYVELHRGREGAYAAMQDHLKSQAVQAFADQYKKVTRQPLKIGRTVLRGNIAHLDAVDPQAREVRLVEQRQFVDQLRNRVEGKYAAGSVKDKLDRARELAAIADQNQVSMFMAQPDDPKNPTLKGDERWTLGDTVEQQLAAVLPQVSRNFSSNEPVTLIPDANMDGKYVNKQRLIKLIEANKRMVASLGTGSGKTSIGLGAFTHLHSKGLVKRGLFAVPSIVQRQFASEGATWLEPGKYSWWANAGAPREERIAAYKNPEHHFAVVTHQALRDDMVHLMAKHAGISEEEMAQRFQGLTEKQRRVALKETLEKEGINWEYLNIDEAHDALNRQGKADSLFANVIDALGMETPYYVSASADPIKNDISELFDQLHKVDPDRYQDRNEFMAKYGINTTASRDALKRELMGRVFPGRVDPGVKAIKHDVPVALSEKQKADYDAVMASYRKARQARAEGKVDLAALKHLSPSSFTGTDDEAMGKRLNDALGTLRDTALARVVNLADPEHNAKMKETIQRVGQYREQGKPGLIFAHHREAVAQLAKQLKAQGHRVVTITGSDSAKEKGRKQLMFNPPNAREPEADIMVVSDAGAVGMNAQRGKWVIHYDIPHTAKTWWQRTGRIHRLGQKDDVDVVTLQTDSILDHKNKARLERKSGLREMLTSPYEGLEESGIASSLLGTNKAPVAA
jgi:superfamily II DNA or RNA helicase